MLETTSADLNLLDQRIYSFGIGSTENVLDIIVDAVNLPAAARAKEPLQLTAHVMARGDLPSQPVTLQVQGETREGTVVYNHQETITFTTNQTDFSLPLTIPALEEGDYTFRVEAAPITGELFLENNRQNKGINVRASKDRVLILTSAPDWELKFLKRSLEDQKSIQVDSYYQHENGLSLLGDRSWMEKQAGISAEIEDATAYANLDELQSALPRYAVIVLHNYLFQAESLEFAHQVRRYVENGGALIFIPGPLNAASLPPSVQEVLPPILGAGVSPTQMQILAQTDGGLLSQVQGLPTNSLPPLYPYYRSRTPSTPGQTLLRGTSSTSETVDLMQLHRYGLGRILVLSTNSFWRWQMLLGEAPLTSFWLTALYQTNPGLSNQKAQLFTDGFLYESLSPVRISYAAQGDVPSATLSGASINVSGPEGEATLWLSPSESRPGLFTTTYTPAEEGEYVFTDRLGSASAAIRVEANPVETYNIRQNVRDLREIAQRTGGEYANTPAWKTLARNLPLATRTVEQNRIQFLGEKWWIAALLIVFLGVEWFIRWRQGLP